jgi:hypothetical protein
MNILLGDSNAKVGRKDIFEPTVKKDSLHEVSNDNGIIVVIFGTTKNLLTMFPHCNIHKFTWTSPEGKTHTEIHHVFIDKR